MMPPPLALYVHLPWCVRKCPYCDFNSYTAGDAAPKSRYIAALLEDLKRESERAAERPLVSIFLGGGTPSFFSPEEIAQILDGIRATFQLQPDVEITMEANPGTVECGEPAGYLAAGVNRLSIGAQSFNDEMLQTLGRIHSSRDIERAVLDARDAGFRNINIDVMHGLPEQGLDAALADIEAALALRPTHISWYQLTLEPNTVFYSRPPANMPNNDEAFAIEEAGKTLLAENGFEQYEISAYAQPGQRCRHNLNYWQFGDYLAVGAGAHGKYTSADGIYRYQKLMNPMQYMLAEEQAEASVAMQALGSDEVMFDYMLNALRLSDGFAEAQFEERTGLTGAELLRGSENARRRGLLQRDAAAFWRPTELGFRFLNDLQAEFVSD